MPLPLACDLINQSEVAEPLRGSTMTFVPCTESSAAYIGYLVFASGPDLCTLSTPLIVVHVCVDVLLNCYYTAVGGIQARQDDENRSSDQSMFREWSCDCAPLSFTSIEAYTLPSKIRQLHTERVQGKG